MRVGEGCWDVIVHGLNELRRLAQMPDSDHKGRPTKRDRRQIIRFRERPGGVPRRLTFRGA
jgi:hypothetical protein